eukprot:SAG22_NODE_21881_length_253_cov_0.675325_1_plen_21_part_10
MDAEDDKFVDVLSQLGASRHK